MIIEGRLNAHIDQTAGILFFNNDMDKTGGNDIVNTICSHVSIVGDTPYY